MTMKQMVVSISLALSATAAWADSHNVCFSDNPPDSCISDEPAPLAVIPERPYTLDWGDSLLGSGDLPEGFTLPTGAVWQPSLFVYGQFRTAIQKFDDTEEEFAEWANRWDLFLQLQLSGTERLVMGFRPLDDNGDINGVLEFTGYNFTPDARDGSVNEFNTQLRTFFFEGDIGEIFPALNKDDSVAFDIGFAVGRQVVNFQSGIMVNDTLDAIGLVHNNLQVAGQSNLRVTALYAWDDINRRVGNINDEDRTANFWGLFTEFDTPWSTIDIDFAYLDADDDQGDGYFLGVSSVQRIGHFNTALRVNTSYADGDGASIESGTLIFGELSWTQVASLNLFYFNAFVGIDEYVSVARDPAVGGPIGQVGILFAAPQIGRFGTGLSNDVNDVYGFALGYQLFFDLIGDVGARSQLIIELGGRQDTDGRDDGAIALGLRYQQAFGQRYVMLLDSFVASNEDRDQSFGLRAEFSVQY